MGRLSLDRAKDFGDAQHCGSISESSSVGVACQKTSLCIKPVVRVIGLGLLWNPVAKPKFS
jgi:hypothetical protein